MPFYVLLLRDISIQRGTRTNYLSSHCAFLYLAAPFSVPDWKKHTRRALNLIIVDERLISASSSKRSVEPLKIYDSRQEGFFGDKKWPKRAEVNLRIFDAFCAGADCKRDVWRFTSGYLNCFLWPSYSPLCRCESKRLAWKNDFLNSEKASYSSLAGNTGNLFDGYSINFFFSSSNSCTEVRAIRYSIQFVWWSVFPGYSFFSGSYFACYELRIYNM